MGEFLLNLYSDKYNYAVGLKQKFLMINDLEDISKYN
jgi:hypothetical protein